MAKIAALVFVLQRDADVLTQRLRALPEELIVRLRASFGEDVGPIFLDDDVVQMFWNMRHADLQRHLPSIRTWYIAAIDALVAQLVELRDLRQTSRQLLVMLPDYREHLARIRWYRQRLAQRAQWMFFWAEEWDQ